MDWPSASKIDPMTTHLLCCFHSWTRVFLPGSNLYADRGLDRRAETHSDALLRFEPACEPACEATRACLEQFHVPADAPAFPGPGPGLPARSPGARTSRANHTVERWSTS